MGTSHWLTERDLDIGYCSVTLVALTTGSTDQEQGIPCLHKCSRLHLAAIDTSVRKWGFRHNRVKSFQFKHAVSPHRLSQRYAETWGNPTVAHHLPEPIIHDSGNKRTTRCVQKQTQMRQHQSIHTIEGSNPIVQRSATDWHRRIEHHLTGRRTGLLKLIQVLSFCRVALAALTTVSTNQ